MKPGRVVVVGGGAAGMMAAGRAAECGAPVVLLEKGPQLARKLRISGKGRGNVTNTADINEFVDAFDPNGKFLYGAFSRYFRDDLIAFLDRMGVPTKVERGGRVFPVSDSARDVCDAFERWITQAGVSVRPNSRVKSVETADGRVTGVRMYGGSMDAAAVVIATGGASYPRTGSTGDGYGIARDLGHTIVPIRPALSALVTQQSWVKNLQGLSLRNVRASLHFEKPGSKPDRVASEFGEMLFTHFGISGPIILTLSRRAAALMGQGRLSVSIDLKPALAEEQLHARLVRDFTQTRHLSNYLTALLPKALAGVFVDLLEIDGGRPVNGITASERKRIVDLLKDFRLDIERMASMEEAIVTAGGVAVREIDPRTMMSKLVDGLFFAGEVIDIDAETGGFNLQAAFSTGYVAGEAAAVYAGGESDD